MSTNWVCPRCDSLNRPKRNSCWNCNYHHIEIEGSSTQPPIVNLNKIWIDLKSLGFFGRSIGAIFCVLGGVMFSSLGIIVWVIILQLISGALIGQDKLGTIFGIAISTLNGTWLLGLFGSLPGLLLGLVMGIVNNRRIWAFAVLVSMGLGYLMEVLYGYPTNVVGIVFYIGAPIQAVWFSGIAVFVLKIKLGLVKFDQIFPMK